LQSTLKEHDGDATDTTATTSALSNVMSISGDMVLQPKPPGYDKSVMVILQNPTYIFHILIF